MWAGIMLCMCMGGLMGMAVKPDAIARGGSGGEYEAGVAESIEAAARAQRLTFEDAGHQPSQRKVEELGKLGWINREDDGLSRRLQAQEVGNGCCARGRRGAGAARCDLPMPPFPRVRVHRNPPTARSKNIFNVGQRTPEQ